ncbi:MAG: aminotransferase class IV, partial [Ignavibacteria bacterium]|nr:aminotransferase class IV [Ignavibacteria bacterium]
MKQIDPFSNTSYKFGFGFFETMRAIYEKIIFFDEHIARLNTSLKKFNLNKVDKEIIYQNILKEIKKKKFKDARIRITYSLQNDNSIITYEVQKFEHTFPDRAKISFSKIKLIHGDELR